MAEVTSPVISPEIPRIRDPQFREIYCNVMSGRMGAMDITFKFSRLIELADGQAAIADQCEITMSPQQCVAISRAIQQTIEAYQRVFGQLNVSESSVAPTLTADQITEMLTATVAKTATARESFAAAVVEATKNQNAISSTEPPPPSKRSRGAAQKKET